MSFDEIKMLATQYLMNTYKRFPVAFVRGEGCYLWDSEGKRYLDLLAGIAVASLGHAHPAILKAIEAQAKNLSHTSNLFYIEPQVRLAEKLVRLSFADKVFFCNSGAEANEAALKLARRYGVTHKGPEGYEIITMEKSFHGRTFATMTATAQSKIHDGFGPLVPGFKYVPYDNLEAVAKVISPKTCAILVEPIQGESGVCIPKPDYLQGLRKLCDQHKILLMLDEVQTGMGRTGKLFAYEHTGIEPDVMTLAKALGGGFPIGACLAKKEIADLLQPGDHASTFGGNFLACSASLAALTLLIDQGLLKESAVVGEYFLKSLVSLKNACKIIQDVWGQGMMLGLRFKQEIPDLVMQFLKVGLVINSPHANLMRLVPPLILKKSQVDEALAIFEKVFKSL